LTLLPGMRTTQREKKCFFFIAAVDLLEWDRVRGPAVHPRLHVLRRGQHRPGEAQHIPRIESIKLFLVGHRQRGQNKPERLSLASLSSQVKCVRVRPKPKILVLLANIIHAGNLARGK
jgi:hypothetical protein